MERSDKMSFADAIATLMRGLRSPEENLEQEGPIVRYADLSEAFYARKEEEIQNDVSVAF